MQVWRVPSRSVGVVGGARVSLLSVQHHVSSEYTPAGRGLPVWLAQAFLERPAPNILVVHPNELHRQQTLERLHQAGADLAPNLHLTLNRLVRLLHTDLRLPVLLDDDASNGLALHARCVQAANDGSFPFLHVPGVGAWTMAKTSRLQRLHAELMHLRRPFEWENDPGAVTYHRLVLNHQADAGGTLPVMVLPSVVGALSADDVLAPFHISNIDGIVLLDTAPDYTEMEQDLLLALARFKPVHQLLCPGSFRLGHHGAYLIDEPPCTVETLPDWLPPHEVWTPSDDGWRTPVSDERNSVISRVTVDERRDAVMATQTFVQTYRSVSDGTVLIVDGSARERSQEWSKALADIGLRWGGGAGKLEEHPLHHALVQTARLGQGMSAWSLASLQRLVFSSTLPLVNDMFPHLTHPVHEHWRPKPDPMVLEDLARQFHVLGGPGAIARWLGVLSNARPSFAERRPELKRQSLEETQWWLASMLRAWAPLLSLEDRYLLNTQTEGCSSGHALPLPDAPADGAAWLSWLLRVIDIDVFSHRRAPHDVGLGALQCVVDSLVSVQSHLSQCGLEMPVDGKAFIDVLEHLGTSVSVNHLTAKTANLHVVSPEDAHGCEADLIILAGLDVDAWGMRTPVVPWLDAEAQVQLGTFQSDRLVRKGRHHLRHLLNAAPVVVVIDSTPEEGGGPSAPLAEWLNDVRRTGEWDAMHEAPSFLPENMTEGDTEERRFRWCVREEGHGSWLTPVRQVMLADGSGQRRVSKGYAKADVRQQIGMDVQGLHPFDEGINNPVALFDSFEAGVQGDRFRRQPSYRDLEEGETMSWDLRSSMLSTDAVVLRPTKASLASSGVLAEEWPHLGHRNSKSVSVTVDPRPLPPYMVEDVPIQHRFGFNAPPYRREVWSPSRLEAWLKCPRQAWMTQCLAADDAEGLEAEDVDARTRGQVVHEAEAALLEGHGVPVGGEVVEGPQPLHLGPLGTLEDAWAVVLAFLQRDVAWLGRNNAVSVHRTRDLVDATPEEWQAFVEGEVELPPRGRLARMLAADFELRHAAPVAVEWSPTTATERSIALIASSETEGVEGLRLFGYADRVDVLDLTETQESALRDLGVLGDEVFDTPYPIDGTPRTAQRLVVIRDLKTVNGPAPKYVGLRHTRCLFEDLQLALYARAWEMLHPNDRVVGVGASEIGESTVHYVELDSDLASIDESLAVGECTRYFPLHFPAFDAHGAPMSPFRRWMVERLNVAQRAVNTAAAGHVNPTPGAHCQYCSLSASCGAAVGSGGGQG